MLTRYLWDYATNTCLAEMDEQGETLVNYTVDPQTGELISENHCGQEVYHRYDGDGNTRQTADSAGNVLGEATYSAFGETVAESGDMQTTYRFRGQQGFSTDPITGDLSQGNHIYSPSLGRRLSLASFGFHAFGQDWRAFHLSADYALARRLSVAQPTLGSSGAQRWPGSPESMWHAGESLASQYIGRALAFAELQRSHWRRSRPSMPRTTPNFGLPLQNRTDCDPSADCGRPPPPACEDFITWLQKNLQVVQQLSPVYKACLGCNPSIICRKKCSSGFGSADCANDQSRPMICLSSGMRPAPTSIRQWLSHLFHECVHINQLVNAPDRRIRCGCPKDPPPRKPPRGRGGIAVNCEQCLAIEGEAAALQIDFDCPGFAHRQRFIDYSRCMSCLAHCGWKANRCGDPPPRCPNPPRLPVPGG